MPTHELEIALEFQYKGQRARDMLKVHAMQKADAATLSQQEALHAFELRLDLLALGLSQEDLTKPREIDYKWGNGIVKCIWAAVEAESSLHKRVRDLAAYIPAYRKDILEAHLISWLRYRENGNVMSKLLMPSTYEIRAIPALKTRWITDDASPTAPSSVAKSLPGRVKRKQSPTDASPPTEPKHFKLAIDVDNTADYVRADSSISSPSNSIAQRLDHTGQAKPIKDQRERGHTQQPQQQQGSLRSEGVQQAITEKTQISEIELRREQDKHTAIERTLKEHIATIENSCSIQRHRIHSLEQTIKNLEDRRSREDTHFAKQLHDARNEIRRQADAAAASREKEKAATKELAILQEAQAVGHLSDLTQAEQTRRRIPILEEELRQERHDRQAEVKKLLKELFEAEKHKETALNKEKHAAELLQEETKKRERLEQVSEGYRKQVMNQAQDISRLARLVRTTESNLDKERKEHEHDAQALAAIKATGILPDVVPVFLEAFSLVGDLTEIVVPGLDGHR